ANDAATAKPASRLSPQHHTVHQWAHLGEAGSWIWYTRNAIQPNSNSDDSTAAPDLNEKILCQNLNSTTTNMACLGYCLVDGSGLQVGEEEEDDEPAAL